MSSVRAVFDELFASRPVALAPMEDVSDAVFRRICRRNGATLCYTEFVNAEGLLRGSVIAKKKLTLAPDDFPTAIQIYGADADRLAEAARVAEDANPAFIDINCGCWVPKVAGRGAGAGWLREPDAMVAMASMVVRAVKLPVTVKTRIGFGPESHMPIVELAQKLESVGISALTVHCRTAQMGHSGRADWSWAKKAQSVVKIPVLVNGDIRSAQDAKRALEETQCAGVMIGRRAIEHPWIFREARALLDRGENLALPTNEERKQLSLEHLKEAVAAYGELGGVKVVLRHLLGYSTGLPRAAAFRASLQTVKSEALCREAIEAFFSGATRSETATD